jgi:hypothetical protein
LSIAIFFQFLFRLTLLTEKMKPTVMYMINSLGRLDMINSVDDYKLVDTVSIIFKKKIASSNKKYMRLLDVEGNVYTITISDANLKIV